MMFCYYELSFNFLFATAKVVIILETRKDVGENHWTFDFFENFEYFGTNGTKYIFMNQMCITRITGIIGINGII